MGLLNVDRFETVGPHDTNIERHNIIASLDTKISLQLLHNLVTKVVLNSSTQNKGYFGIKYHNRYDHQTSPSPK